MSAPQPAPLAPALITLSDPAFREIQAWPFNPQPFYEGQVTRLLQNDIPIRLMHELCLIWVYRDQARNLVGFGTLSVCKDYERFTGGKDHTYLPVLAVNPAFQKRGHGRRIVEHLVAETVLLTQSLTDLSDLLFLDVYTANQPAITLYEKAGFETLNPDTPIPDTQENNEPYFVMAKRVSIASGSMPPWPGQAFPV